MSPTILVIESNLDLAEVIQTVLLGQKYTCITASHDHVELAQLDENDISLVICELDILAANRNFHSYLKTFLLFHSASVIYTTGSYMPEAVPSNQILQKPFSFDALVAMVKAHADCSALGRSHLGNNFIAATYSDSKVALDIVRPKPFVTKNN